MKKNSFLPLIASALVLIPMLFSHSCANTTQAPTGGKKDTIPPVIVNIEPLPGVLHFPLEKGKIVFTFNEYVKIEKPQSIFLSPPQAKRPKSKIKGKSLVIEFEEPLSPNTTYTLDLNDGISDNNENNKFPGFTFVFSTGDTIDTLFTTGVVLDCNTLLPVDGATVMLYRDHSDSAIFLRRPDVAAKTDKWGYFVLPYLRDTAYRLYAVQDASNNNIYDPEEDLIAFSDSIMQPVWAVGDTIPELLKYDMTDTLGCEARRVAHTLLLFREKPSQQYIKNKARTGLRSAYVSFHAPYAWIDSLWFGGFKAEEVISQFNTTQDSLELWLNSREDFPDTLHLFMNYRRTDSLGILTPKLEHLKLPLEPDLKKKYAKRNRRNLEHQDTICVYKLEASGDRVEQYGFELEFKSPIIYENFDSLVFRNVNPKQKEAFGTFTVTRDSTNLRRYTIMPDEELQKGYEYFLKVPQGAFRDIDGFYSDSTEVKVSLPTDETLSTLRAILTGVDGKYIVELLDEKMAGTLRSFVINSDRTLVFPYLKEGRYCLRITSDGNENSVVDTGNLLEHRQPELVKFVLFSGDKFLTMPKSAELDQEIDIKAMFGNE